MRRQEARRRARSSDTRSAHVVLGAPLRKRTLELVATEVVGSTLDLLPDQRGGLQEGWKSPSQLVVLEVPLGSHTLKDQIEEERKKDHKQEGEEVAFSELLRNRSSQEVVGEIEVLEVRKRSKVRGKESRDRRVGKTTDQIKESNKSVVWSVINLKRRGREENHKHVLDERELREVGEDREGVSRGLTVDQESENHTQSSESTIKDQERERRGKRHREDLRDGVGEGWEEVVSELVVGDAE